MWLVWETIAHLPYQIVLTTCQCVEENIKSPSNFFLFKIHLPISNCRWFLPLCPQLCSLAAIVRWKALPVGTVCYICAVVGILSSTLVLKHHHFPLDFEGPSALIWDLSIPYSGGEVNPGFQHNRRSRSEKKNGCTNRGDPLSRQKGGVAHCIPKVPKYLIPFLISYSRIKFSAAVSHSPHAGCYFGLIVVDVSGWVGDELV